MEHSADEPFSLGFRNKGSMLFVEVPLLREAATGTGSQMILEAPLLRCLVMARGHIYLASISASRWILFMSCLS